MTTSTTGDRQGFLAALAQEPVRGALLSMDESNLWKFADS